MGHIPIQQKNGPLTTEIAILNLERRAHWNFKFISNKWKMAHTMVCPAIASCDTGGLVYFSDMSSKTLISRDGFPQCLIY